MPLAELLPPTRRQVTEWARLTQKKFRRERAEFLIEGEVCVREALRAGAPLEAILLLGETEERYADIMRLRAYARIPIYRLNTADYSRITPVESSQGIVAVGQTFSLPARDSRISLACEQVSDPGNCGALIRVAEFFGSGVLYLGPESAEIWNPKVVRGSMGSIFHQPLREATDLAELIEQWPGTTAALVAHGGTPLRQARSLRPPLLLLLGHETRGISSDLVDLCREHLSLEPQGQAESLNLVTAAAVFAFALSE